MKKINFLRGFAQLIAVLSLFTFFACEAPVGTPNAIHELSKAARGAWAPNVAYAAGDTVTYNGVTYTCVQSHTSLVGWEPPNVPALWSVGGGTTTPTPTPTPTPSGPVGPAGYTWCANENSSFTLPGTCDVAYGANGTFAYLYNKTGTITFNNATFGDPLPGVVKAGFYKLSSASGINWPDGQFLPSFQALANPMDVLNASSFNSDVNKVLMTLTLEGLVNRTKPRIYVIDSDSNENSQNWFSTLNVGRTNFTDPYQLITKYRSEIAGIVIFDPNIVDTRNVAVSVASVQNGLVVSPTLATTLQAAPYNLPVLTDLRGKFSSKLSAYQWLKDNYWSQLTHKALFSLDPSMGFSMADYVMALKGYVHYLDPRDSSEKILLDSLVSNLPVNAPAVGWWHNPENGGEQAHITYYAQHGHPGLGFDFVFGASVFGGASRTINVPAIPARPALDNKIYVTLIMSDGDNVQADQHAIKDKWNDSRRGQVPIGWTLSPALVDVAPNMLNWYWQNATANDCLISGPSGLGYTYPDSWNNDSALTTYVKSTANYMNKAGLRSITIWQNSYENFAGNAGNIYANNLPNILGVFQQNDSMLDFVGAMPETGQATNYSGSGEAGMVSAISSFASAFDGTKPRFIAAQAVLWSTSPTNLYNVMTTLKSQNPNYVFVRPDQFFQLIQDSRSRGLAVASTVFEAEGSRLPHRIGRADKDGWSADTSLDNQDYLSYGPYINTLPVGNQRAIFRMMVDNNTANNDKVCTIDVHDNNTGAILATHDCYRHDWTGAGVYQDFSLDYTFSNYGDGVEYRVYWYDTSYLRLDKIIVTAR